MMSSKSWQDAAFNQGPTDNVTRSKAGWFQFTQGFIALLSTPMSSGSAPTSRQAADKGGPPGAASRASSAPWHHLGGALICRPANHFAALPSSSGGSGC
mmetsp:Transcript_16989/g.47028  ORF Transcript_16989/g.47028 Transcript_16989/m.47028 type:complete len:99 (+) Transcript_16989:942-1238(+)